jgi:hypothetical protein
MDMNLLARKVERAASNLERFYISKDTKYHSAVYKDLKNVYAIECATGSSIESYMVIAKVYYIEGSGTVADAFMKDLSDLYFGWDEESGIVKKADMYYDKKHGWLWAVGNKGLYKATPEQITKLMITLSHDLVKLSFEEPSK